jgi:hypothetical protein
MIGLGVAVEFAIELVNVTNVDDVCMLVSRLGCVDEAARVEGDVLAGLVCDAMNPSLS